jgi:hypothetical protein
MSANVVTVTEAVRHFSDYISRVVYRRESFVEGVLESLPHQEKKIEIQSSV